MGCLLGGVSYGPDAPAGWYPPLAEGIHSVRYSAQMLFSMRRVAKPLDTPTDGYPPVAWDIERVWPPPGGYPPVSGASATRRVIRRAVILPSAGDFAMWVFPH